MDTRDQPNGSEENGPVGLTTADELRSRHSSLIELLQGLESEPLTPEHVTSICKIALNFSNFAQEVENNRLEQLATIKRMCANRVMAPNKKLTNLIDYVDIKLKS